MSKKTVLLVNPWIYDFAAYDLWLKPWGLLKISSILKKSGFRVFFLDLLDRHHPLIEQPVRDHPDGTGKFIAQKVQKPDVLKNIPRTYKRYGLSVEKIERALPDEKIDFILISSVMTYWYPGVFEAIGILKKKYPGVPVILGGAYATLCHEHAKEKSGADLIIRNKELHKLGSIMGKDIDLSFENILKKTIDYECYRDPGYGVIRISLGCPFDCLYCAQKLLNPEFMLKDQFEALAELSGLYEKGVKNFAFYDDALFFNMEYMKSYLEGIIASGIRGSFYTPNGLHARFISKEIAELMRKTNFVNPMLSLETSDKKKEKLWHKKVTTLELKEAISNLRKAGYDRGEYSVYVLLGAPGSGIEEVKGTIDLAHSLGARVSLSEYSPVPGTIMAQDLPGILEEPLLQNNSIYPVISLSEWNEFRQAKDLARSLNSYLSGYSR